MSRTLGEILVDHDDILEDCLRNCKKDLELNTLKNVELRFKNLLEDLTRRREDLERQEKEKQNDLKVVEALLESATFPEGCSWALSQTNQVADKVYKGITIRLPSGRSIYMRFRNSDPYWDSLQLYSVFLIS